MTMPFLVYISDEMYRRKSVVNIPFQILVFDFNPRLHVLDFSCVHMLDVYPCFNSVQV